MSSFPPPPAYQAPAEQPQGEPPIWAPYYGITFVPAIRRALSKYADFTGRASRSEFWWWYLGIAIVGIVLDILAGIVAGIGRSASGAPGPGYFVFTIILVLFGLAIIVPQLAVTWRRLHDGNFAGPFFFLSLIPFVGGIIVLVLLILPSKPEGQRFDRPRG
ncbi:MAG: hypothetical protein JWP75_683 [Frondihabitans sp.]|nr:hypothetical protein [Frondihabitans sp.]